jgi:meprin B
MAAIFQLAAAILIAVLLADARPSINESDVPIENGEFTPVDIAGYFCSSDDDHDTELGDKFEGDIMEHTRNSSLWPRKGKKVFVPFIIDEDSSYSAHQIYTILAAMEAIEQATCIDFTWRDNHDDFIFIYSGSGCSSYVGRIGGWQPLSLDANATCGSSKGTIIHQLMHALGVNHMHNKADRDRYIIVDVDNLDDDDVRRNFARHESDEMSLTYDYYSIMHCGPYAFSKNGHPSVVTKNGFYQRIIGQRNLLSPGDVKLVRRMYKCNCVERGKRRCS